MKVWDINFRHEVLIKINKYKINWLKAPSKEQKIIQDFLYPFWCHKIVLQEFRIPSSLLRIDLICCNSRTCIEYSPKSHHGTYNKFFHGGSRNNYLSSLKRDCKKYEWITDPRNSLKFIELNETDLPFLSPKYILDKFGINII